MKTNERRSSIAKAVLTGATLCLALSFSIQAKAVIGGEAASDDRSFMGLITGFGEDVETRTRGCAAVFLDQHWLVTSGNCLLQYYTGRYPYPVNNQGSFALSGDVLDIELIYGDNDIASEAVTRVVPSSVVFHPGFLLASDDYNPVAPDVALVSLSEPADVRTLDLAEAGVLEKMKAAGLDARIMGWGATEYLTLDTWDWMTANKRSTVLSEAVLRVDESCSTDFVDETTPGWISAMTFCASDPKEVADYCGGDGGGPLLLTDKTTGELVLAGINLNLMEDCAGGAQTPAIGIEYVADWIDSVVTDSVVMAERPEIEGEIGVQCWAQYCKFSGSDLNFDGVAPVDLVWTMTHRSQERTYASSFSGILMESWVHPDQVYDVTVRARAVDGHYSTRTMVLDLNTIELQELATMTGSFAVSCDGLRCKFDASQINFGGIQLHSVIWYPKGMREGIQARGLTTEYVYNTSDIYTIEVVGFDPNGNMVKLMGGVSVSGVDGVQGTMFTTLNGSLGPNKRMFLADAKGFESRPGRIQAVFYTSNDDVSIKVQQYQPDRGWKTVKEKIPEDGRVRVNYPVTELGMYRYRVKVGEKGASFVMHYLLPE